MRRGYRLNRAASVGRLERAARATGGRAAKFLRRAEGGGRLMASGGGGAGEIFVFPADRVGGGTGRRAGAA